MKSWCLFGLQFTPALFRFFLQNYVTSAPPLLQDLTGGTGVEVVKVEWLLLLKFGDGRPGLPVCRCDLSLPGHLNEKGESAPPPFPAHSASQDEFRPICGFSTLERVGSFRQFRAVGLFSAPSGALGSAAFGGVLYRNERLREALGRVGKEPFRFHPREGHRRLSISLLPTTPGSFSLNIRWSVRSLPSKAEFVPFFATVLAVLRASAYSKNDCFRCGHTLSTSSPTPPGHFIVQAASVGLDSRTEQPPFLRLYTDWQKLFGGT